MNLTYFRMLQYELHWESTSTLNKLHTEWGCKSKSVRAVPEIILGGLQTLFCPVGGGCFVDNVSEGWGMGEVTCPGGQGVFYP